VTFSDTFRTESLLVYKESEDPATKLPRVTARHYMYVQFLKFSIVKSKIRSESTKELKEGMRKHNELTAEYLRGAPSSSSLSQALASGAGKTAAGPTAAPSAAAVQQAGPAAASAPATAATAAARPAAAAALTRQDSQPQPRRAGGPVASAAAAQGAPGASVLVPEAMTVKFAMLPMLALALLYTLKAVWNSFWFYPDAVPLAAATAAAEGAVVGEATVALQQLAAANTAAAFMSDVLRPAVTALAWALGAALISWISAMAP
jgi:hypothetical protein